MKKAIIILAGILALAGCTSQPKVMARYVPERMDDFVFENNLIAGRIYGEALEGNPTSPGIDIWVKLPGALVANDWFKHFVEDGNEEYYHQDHGGKDCYKVAVSLGGGASVPVVEGRFLFPATNYRSYRILTDTAEKVEFVLEYPQWEADVLKIALSKKITVIPDTYFLHCEDCYTFEGADSLLVVAGVNRHLALETIQEEMIEKDRYALWEKASDTHAEPEEGMIGVAVYVPGAEISGLMNGESHGVCGRFIKSGEPFSYYFGNCWSKGNVKSAQEWFNLVKKL